MIVILTCFSITKWAIGYIVHASIAAEFCDHKFCNPMPTGPTMLQTSVVPRERENDSTFHEESSSSVVIAVSAVCLLLITLTTVILTQRLLIIRMRRSIHRNETYTEVMTPTTMNKDVPVSPNEAYAVTKMTSANEDVTYELVK